ncbi:MAG: hypothetical protein WD401_05090 [Thermomicrobiaceae bacterium]
MERWEPPRAEISAPSNRRWKMPEIPRRDLPEIWLMVGIRLGITLVLVAAVLFEDLRDQMYLAVIALIAGLLAIIVQTDRAQTQTVRRQTILDLAILVTVVPVAVLNYFVAAEPGNLLPAEWSALLQTGGGLLIVVTLVVWLSTFLFPEDRTLIVTGVLPGLIVVLTMTFVLHDYRNQTVLAMVAVSYFIGAAAVALGAMVEEPVRRYIPAVFYGSTIIAGLALFDPGLQNVFERDGLVQSFSGMMILIGLAVLILIPNPSMGLTRLTRDGQRQTRPRSRRTTGRTDDSGRNTTE